MKKTLTVVRPGTYGTRMLKAGDPLECSGPEARMYAALGWAAEVERAEEVEKPKAKRRKRAAAKK
jgi:hypothetical protein